MLLPFPRQLLFILALAALLSALPAGEASAQSPESVLRRTERGVAAETRAQEQVRQWADDRDELSAEIRDQKMQDAWLDFQIEKYRRYLELQRQTIAELERRKEEARRIEMELEPFLETVVDSLEQEVGRDLPFLPEERAQRIAFLHRSLDDYHLSLSEKLRRVLEALQVEAEYGHTVETRARTITLDGEPTLVTVFRLGRTALFYLTSDGSAAGVWDREANGWRALDQDEDRILTRARDMAARRRAVELLPLPVPLSGAPGPAAGTSEAIDTEAAAVTGEVAGTDNAIATGEADR